MYPNKNSGLGQLMAIGLIDVAGIDTTGRFFIVSNSTDVNATEIKALYGNNYPDGTPVIYTSLSLALAKCVADRGDVIFIAPGHSETITSAAGINVNVSNINIVGCGNGIDRPTFTFTTAVAASFDVTAANVKIQNILFINAIDAQTAMSNINATDVAFSNCEFRTNSGTTGTILGLYFGGTATSDRFLVSNCRFVGPAINTGTTTTAQIQYEQAVDGQIMGSYFTGKETQAVLNTTGAVLRGLISGNYFVIATGTKAIAVNSGSTPFISNNRINVPSGTAPIVAAAGFVAGNIYSAAAGVTAGTAATI